MCVSEPQRVFCIVSAKSNEASVSYTDTHRQAQHASPYSGKNSRPSDCSRTRTRDLSMYLQVPAQGNMESEDSIARSP